MADILREKDLNKPVLRKIRRIKDGAIKSQNATLAARLVAKGQYVYVDGGPDESVNLPRRKKIATAEKTPSDVLHLAKIPEIQVEEGETPYTGPQQTIRSDMGFTERATPSDHTPNPNRKVQKKASVPKEKMDYILRSNISNPTPVETSKNAGSLKDIMDKVRSERK